MRDGKRFDVVVLGSGFGGSLLAAVLAREGMSVGMIDRRRHPRFAIGESSTPAADLLLRAIAARHDLPELEPLSRFGTWRASYPELNCGCKRGFSYFWHGKGNEFQAASDHRHELLVTANVSRDMADTQWYRADVDRFLAELAQRHGAGCLEEAEVTNIQHPRANEWTLSIDRQGERRTWRSAFLVDASGPVGLLIRRMDVRDGTHRLRTCSSAVYGHWSGVRPLGEWLAARGAVISDYPYPCGDSAVHHLFDDGWLWQLRFENDLTSLGFVSAGQPAGEGESAERDWASLLERRPVVAELLHGARLTEFPGRVQGSGRLQRLWSAAAGQDWAALPFTTGFVDPLHSTGIAHTLSGVERLGRILPAASSSARSKALSRYSEDVVAELLHVDRLVSGCYHALRDFRLFTTWSMLYFAAATTYERRWLTADESDARPSFLCAGDAGMARILETLESSRRWLCRRPGPLPEADFEAFREQVRRAILPYNHVGLFEAPVPNMYHHTAAETS